MHPKTYFLFCKQRAESKTVPVYFYSTCAQSYGADDSFTAVLRQKKTRNYLKGGKRLPTKLYMQKEQRGYGPHSQGYC
jgi:hypothetical protein